MWDRLVIIEGGNLHDAELLEQARAFKKKYLERAESTALYEDIRTSWVKWKERHGIVHEEMDESTSVPADVLTIVLQKKASGKRLIDKAYSASSAGVLTPLTKTQLNAAISTHSKFIVALDSPSGPSFRFETYSEKGDPRVGVIERFGRKSHLVNVSKLGDVTASKLLSGIQLLSQGELFFPGER